MKKTFKVLMAAVAVTVLSWPTVCFGQEEEREIEFAPINKQEYLTAKEDSCAYNLYPKKFTGNSPIKDEFLSMVIEIDDKARYAYSESEDSDGWFSYDYSEIISGEIKMYMLEFVTPVFNFCYFATKSVDGTLCVSDEKMYGAPIVISKEGYIAGFEDNGDLSYVLTLYRYSLDKTTGCISIKKFGTFIDGGDSLWQVNWECPNPAFWSADTLYVEGIKSTEEDADWERLKSNDIISYYKLDISGLK